LIPLFSFVGFGVIFQASLTRTACPITTACPKIIPENFIGTSAS